MTKLQLKQLINEVLLNENPDTINYKGSLYRYSSPANRSAFFVYKDRDTHKDTLFGYSAIKEEFFSSDDGVMVKLKEYESGGSDSYELDTFYDKDTGGGHNDLEELLSTLKINYHTPERGRLFEIDDGGTKVGICTFWNGKNRVLPYMKFWEQAIEFNGYDPKEILYEPSKGFFTYEQLLNPNYVPTYDTITIRNGSKAKVGDKLTYYVYSTSYDERNPQVVVKRIVDDENVEVEIVKFSTDEFWLGKREMVSYRWLGPAQVSNEPEDEDIQSLINVKQSEFVEKRASLHTTGARLTPAEKQNLENEVDMLEIEIKGLKYLLDNSSFIKMTSDAKFFLQKFIDHEMAKKHDEKKDVYSLIKQAEKQYNMPIVQLRQKYRGVPLDKLVKKESLYRKIMKQMLLN